MIRVAILTVSDSSYTGERADLSGPALKKHCEELSWVVVETEIVPDSEIEIAQRIERWSDTNAASLILTTGGTGVAPRDVTPEATRRVMEREVPGLAEHMRTEGLKQTRFSVVSRAITGTRKQTLIVNLPGSPKGAIFSLQVIQDLIPHIVDLLEGRTKHCQK